jgi:hypothetical protein
MRRRFSAGALVLVATVAAGACRTAQDLSGGPLTVPSDFRLEHERTGCFGECPVYRLTITADGGITIVGIKNVIAVGQHTASLTKAELEDVISTIESTRYLRIRSACIVDAPDVPSVTTRVTMNRRTNATCSHAFRLVWPENDPFVRLAHFEEHIHAVAAKRGWVEPFE